MAAQVTYRKQRIGQHLIGRGEGPDSSFRQTTYHFTKARKRLNNLVADCCFKPYIIPLAVAREKIEPSFFQERRRMPFSISLIKQHPLSPYSRDFFILHSRFTDVRV